MLKRVLLLTGRPGVGKTTVLVKATKALARRGYKVGGMISQEVRVNYERVGFEIVNLGSSKRGWLARVDQRSGPRVGKYYVSIKDLEAIGSESIVNAVENCDVVVIDEIGPMELFSEKFREATNLALRSKKLVLAVVHWKATDRLVVEARSRDDAETKLVTVEDREKLVELVVSEAIQYLEKE